MNGVQIWIGRNWTPFQLVSILYFGVIVLEFLINRRSLSFTIPKSYYRLSLLLLLGNALSIVFMSSLSEVRYIRDDFTESRYFVISIWHFLWLIQNMFTVLIIFNEIKSKERLIKFFKITLNSSIFYAVYGLYQYSVTYILGDNSKYFVYILKPEYLWGPEAIRIASLDREPLYYAFYLNFILLLTLTLIINKHFILSKKKLIIIFSINFLTFVLTRATAGFLAFVVALTIYYLKNLKLRELLSSANKLLNNIVLFLFSIVLLLSFFLANQRRIERRVGTVTEVDTGYVRLRSIVQGIETFFDNIYFGVGLGNSPYYIATEVVHNMYIQVLVETGLFGFLGVMFWIIYHFRAAKKIENKSINLMFYLLMVTVCFQWLSFYNFNLPIVWVFSGLILAITKIEGCNNEILN
jgi:O-antigen ligase